MSRTGQEECNFFCFNLLMVHLLISPHAGTKRVCSWELVNVVSQSMPYPWHNVLASCYSRQSNVATDTRSSVCVFSLQLRTKIISCLLCFNSWACVLSFAATMGCTGREDSEYKRTAPQKGYGGVDNTEEAKLSESILLFLTFNKMGHSCSQKSKAYVRALLTSIMLTVIKMMETHPRQKIKTHPAKLAKKKKGSGLRRPIGELCTQVERE